MLVPHESGIIQLSFCDRLIALSSRSSRFMHVIMCIRISFLLRLNNILLYVYTTFCLFSHLLMNIWVVSTYGQLCCYEHWCTNICSSSEPLLLIIVLNCYPVLLQSRYLLRVILQLDSLLKNHDFPALISLFFLSTALTTCFSGWSCTNPS